MKAVRSDQMESSKKFGSVEEYFESVSDKAKPLLQQMRNAIKEAAPEAQEVISYNMPAFKLNGVLVYYAAWKNHVALYPASAFNSDFADDLSAYKHSKGTLQFPIEEGIPIDLVKKIVLYRVHENQEKAQKKAN